MAANTIKAHGVMGGLTKSKNGSEDHIPKTKIKVLAKGIDGTLYVLPDAGLNSGDTISVLVE